MNAIAENISIAVRRVTIEAGSPSFVVKPLAKAQLEIEQIATIDIETAPDKEAMLAKENGF